MKKTAALIAAIAGMVLYLAPSAQAAFNCGTTLDTFTRANSTNLGTNWTEVAPNPAIAQGAFTDPLAETGLATYNGATANEACADVFSAPNLSYAAIDLQYGSLTSNVFVKVQDNVAPYTGFDTLYFYKGNNGAAFGGSTPRPLTPFTAGRFHVIVNGTNVTADIDTNFDGNAEQSFTQGGLTTTGLGTQIGLGAYGNARLDNFAIPKSAAPAAFRCGGKTATLVGTNAGEVIKGTSAADVIVGLGGADTIRGKGGKDYLCGGGGRDKLFGGKAKDKLFGQQGRDKLYGGPRNDTCIGGPGTDTTVQCEKGSP